MQVKIKHVHHFFNEKIQFIANIKCPKDTPYRILLQKAVKWAIKRNISLVYSDLRAVDLSKLNLKEIDFTGCILIDANLEGADLTKAVFDRASLDGANLKNTKCLSTSFRKTYFTGADLTNADLSGSDCAESDFTGAILTGTYFPTTNVREAKGISNRIIDGGVRSDGYRFFLTRTDPGEWRIKFRHFDFTVTKAIDHCNLIYSIGNPLRGESLLIIDHMLAVANIRGWEQK